MMHHVWSEGVMFVIDVVLFCAFTFVCICCVMVIRIVNSRAGKNREPRGFDVIATRRTSAAVRADRGKK